MKNKLTNYVILCFINLNQVTNAKVLQTTLVQEVNIGRHTDENLRVPKCSCYFYSYNIS